MVRLPAILSFIFPTYERRANYHPLFLNTPSCNDNFQSRLPFEFLLEGERLGCTELQYPEPPKTPTIYCLALGYVGKGFNRKGRTQTSKFF